MKIGLVCPYNITLGSGVSDLVRELRRELRARGHTVKILTPEPRKIAPPFDKRGVIFVGAGADFRSPLATTAQVSASMDIDAIDEVLTRERFDILHFHEPWVPMLSWQILSRSQTINVATFHAKLPDTMMSKTISRVVTPYTKSILRYLHSLTAVSNAATEYVSELTDRQVTIIPNGVDLKRFRPPRATRRKPNEPMTILYVGRLERRKGVKYLLWAFKLLQQDRPHVRLIIAGDGPNRARLEEMSRSLGISDNVTFCGFVSDAQKIKLLQKADLFCSAAVYGESFGIVLLEAMAAGTVIVAGDNPGYRDVMRDFGAISLINPHDSAEFANRLDLLLHDTDLRSKWKRWAKREVQQYSYRHIVDQYETIYNEAVKLPVALPAPSKRFLFKQNRPLA